MKKFIFLPIYYGVISMALPFITSMVFSPSAQFVYTEDMEISVFNHMTSQSEEMKLEDYLVGVVAAEMPASFEEEALKAQAVAARTYTFYKSDNDGHKEDVCTDSNHCQAYLTKEEMATNWGNDYPFYFEKIKNAVYSTKGEIITYNHEPAMAVFHSMGGGKTENSADVWGNSVPYLVSVDSPGEEVAANYNTTLRLSFDEFKSKIQSVYPSAIINSYTDISQPVLTEGGHVKSILIGSVSIPGTSIRSIFSLRSTKFQLSFEGNTVTFLVTGYGHGVGMSQYGANAMAKTGKSYKEILSHYYQGTTLVSETGDV